MCDHLATGFLLQTGGGDLTSMLMPLALMFVIFYFLLIRPQSKERRQQASMRAALQKGDKILTQGGIIAKVREVKEKEIVLDLDGAKMRVVRDSVIRVLDESGLQGGKSTKSTESTSNKALEQSA